MTATSKQLIVIGDSGVYGWGDPQQGGWCDRLKYNWMKQPNTPIIYPLGVRGDGLERVAKRWKNEWIGRGELRRNVPSGLLIMIGLNDTARIGRADGRPQLTAEAYRFGLKQLLAEIKLYTNVMVMGLTAVDEEAMPFAECLWYSNEAVSIYEAQIEETCLEENLPFMPLHKDMLSEELWKTWIEPDGIHLNSEGHSWVYGKISIWPPLLEWAGLERTKNLTPTLH